MMQSPRWVVVVLVAVLAAGAAAQKPADKAPAGTANDQEYVIGPEDVLSVNVWKEPEVSAAVPVRPDGKISLPLLNDVQAAGKTPMQLADAITEQLKQFLTDPRVTVVVNQMNSRRIFIMGEVSRTGPMQMLPNMTVLQALSAAGGFSQFANTKKIYVLRNEGGKQTKIPVNYKAVLNGASEQNFLLKPGDTVVVP